MRVVAALAAVRGVGAAVSGAGAAVGAAVAGAGAALSGAAVAGVAGAPGSAIADAAGAAGSGEDVGRATSHATPTAKTAPMPTPIMTSFRRVRWTGSAVDKSG